VHENLKGDQGRDPFQNCSIKSPRKALFGANNTGWCYSSGNVDLEKGSSGVEYTVYQYQSLSFRTPLDEIPLSFFRVTLISSHLPHFPVSVIEIRRLRGEPSPSTSNLSPFYSYYVYQNKMGGF